MTNKIADELEGVISDIEAGVANSISAETLRRVAKELRNPWKRIQSLDKNIGADQLILISVPFADTTITVEKQK